METIYKSLDEEDVRKLRAERRMGRVFFYLSILAAFLFCVFMLTAYENTLLACSGTPVFLLLGWLSCRLVNRDVNRDLAEGVKMIAVKDIDRIECNPLFDDEKPRSNAFNYRFSNYRTGYFLVSGRLKYSLDAETYRRVRFCKRCEVHYAPKSYTVLGIYPA